MGNKKIFTIFLLSLLIIQFPETVLAENSFTAHLGDNSSVELWLGLMISSFLGFLLTCYWEGRARKNK